MLLLHVLRTSILPPHYFENDEHRTVLYPLIFECGHCREKTTYAEIQVSKG